MLISATNLPNSSEIPLSCSLNLALKNFFCWFCSCCCCWRFSLRLPCLGSEIFLSWGCWPPITRPFEQWPLLRWPPLIPPFGKSLWKINKGLLLFQSCHKFTFLLYTRSLDIAYFGPPNTEHYSYECSGNRWFVDDLRLKDYGFQLCLEA